MTGSDHSKMNGKRDPISHTCFAGSFDTPCETDFFEKAATVNFRQPEATE